MSQVSIPDIEPNISIEEEHSISLLLSSIALEEIALAHVINSEAEKIQFIVNTLDNSNLEPQIISISDLFVLNQEISRTLRNVIKKEILLNMKMTQIVTYRKSTTIELTQKLPNTSIVQQTPDVDLTPKVLSTPIEIFFTQGIGEIGALECEKEISIQGIIKAKNETQLSNIVILLYSHTQTGNASLTLKQGTIVPNQNGVFSTQGIYMGIGKVLLQARINLTGVTISRETIINVNC